MDGVRFNWYFTGSGVVLWLKCPSLYFSIVFEINSGWEMWVGKMQDRRTVHTIYLDGEQIFWTVCLRCRMAWNQFMSLQDGEQIKKSFVVMTEEIMQDGVSLENKKQYDQRERRQFFAI